ncbi:unnamed protein product [Sphagnum tenellum]
MSPPDTSSSYRLPPLSGPSVRGEKGSLLITVRGDENEPRPSSPLEALTVQKELICDGHIMSLSAYFRVAARRRGFDPVYGADLMLMWRLAAHNESTLKALVEQEAPPLTKNKLVLLFMRELSSVSPNEIPETIGVNDVVDETANFFLDIRPYLERGRSGTPLRNNNPPFEAGERHHVANWEDMSYRERSPVDLQIPRDFWSEKRVDENNHFSDHEARRPASIEQFQEWEDFSQTTPRHWKNQRKEPYPSPSRLPEPRRAALSPRTTSPPRHEPSPRRELPPRLSPRQASRRQLSPLPRRNQSPSPPRRGPPSSRRASRMPRRSLTPTNRAAAASPPRAPSPYDPPNEYGAFPDRPFMKSQVESAKDWRLNERGRLDRKKESASASRAINNSRNSPRRSPIHTSWKSSRDSPLRSP